MSPDAPVIWHDEIDSTNEEAKRVAARGQFLDHWIAARRQSAGRGRLGRTWVSPPGNLYASALILVPGGIEYAIRLPFAAGLAVLDAAGQFAPQAALKLKWPNDVRSDGRKLSGILVESGSADHGVWAVVGIGVNIAEVPESAGQAATCMADLAPGRPLSAEDMLSALRISFSARYAQAMTDFPSLRADWCEHAEGRDAPMRAKIGSEEIEGLFDGLDPDGGLALRLHNGERRIIRAGDVELVRKV